MYRIICVLLVLVFIFSCNDNGKNAKSNRINFHSEEQPKLVVGIIVDQMRFDYLNRFQQKYQNDGFLRLVNEGYSFNNNHFNYIPTYTGPGHASISTGTVPRDHGIIANEWYDKNSGDMVYCVYDNQYHSLGTTTASGQKSPQFLRATTFADENKLSTQMRGKTFGVSIKDRAAILSTGRSADAAYWFQGEDEGKWVSSSYYMDMLPGWVNDYNDTDFAKRYIKEWNTLLPIQQYNESGLDDNSFEEGFEGKINPTFPYDLEKLKKTNDNYDILKSTPFGNTIITDFALTLLAEESLGKDSFTDVLMVSYSSTDYIGHNFGVNSKELEDTYLRLDIEIARLLTYLDKNIGSGAYTVFLTSDHGVSHIPARLRSLKLNAGILNSKLLHNFYQFLLQRYGSSKMVSNYSNGQIYLNHEEIFKLGLNLDEVQEELVRHLLTYPNLSKVYSSSIMSCIPDGQGTATMIRNGYHQKISGDIMLVADPAYIEYSGKGTTHGSGYNYDTHVPLLFFGAGVKNGYSYEHTNITDVAPTISALLGISYPNASTGRVLEDALD